MSKGNRTVVRPAVFPASALLVYRHEVSGVCCDSPSRPRGVPAIGLTGATDMVRGPRLL
jgi:hypothetical protein